MRTKVERPSPWFPIIESTMLVAKTCLCGAFKADIGYGTQHDYAFLPSNMRACCVFNTSASAGWVARAGVWCRVSATTTASNLNSRTDVYVLWGTKSNFKLTEASRTVSFVSFQRVTLLTRSLARAQDFVTAVITQRAITQ